MNIFSRSEYTLIDSGDEEKLEKIGDKLIIRPSKFCIWEKNDPAIWQTADFKYNPKESNWIQLKKSLPNFWHFKIKGKVDDFKFTCRLQNNGQIGIFPEHLSYLDQLFELTKDSEKRVLNLFAYTGLATTYFLKKGYSVTHNDVSEATIEWTLENLKLNNLDTSKFRAIKEDAVSFTNKELKREKKYDLIILDPPSFSRINKKDSWKIEEIFKQLLKTCVALLADKGVMAVTNHAYEFNDMVIANLLKGLVGKNGGLKNYSFIERPLFIEEGNTGRKLPAGFLCIMSSK